MTTVSVTLPQDGSTADVADYNTPITTIVTALNGNIDSTNVASLNGSKLVAASVPGSALDSNLAGGWITGLTAPTTVTYNGNRNYSLVFNSTDLTSTISAGFRLRTTRTVAAPTQCTSLNGSTQYYSKTSPAGFNSVTDDFATGAWVKLTAYGGSSSQGVISRFNNTSGWIFFINGSGQVKFSGFNGSSSNYTEIQSYQSIPLNKWVHISAQLDMSSSTVTGGTANYIMIDGVDVPIFRAQGGTNPTSLLQAGNLEVGSYNGGTSPFPGKIAQAFVTSAKLTQTQVRAIYSQGLTSSDVATYSIVSAYSFNNSITDINTTNANNLTASGSAVATNADSPFGTQASGLISSTLDYAIVQSATFSTNTTVVVQVPEGCTIPTSGGVSAAAYSSQKAPYGMPTQRGKWILEALTRTTENVAIAGTGSWASGGSSLSTFTIPIGEWAYGFEGSLWANSTASGVRNMIFAMGSATPSALPLPNIPSGRLFAPSSFDGLVSIHSKRETSLTSATTYRMYGYLVSATGTEVWRMNGGEVEFRFFAEPAHL